MYSCRVAATSTNDANKYTNKRTNQQPTDPSCITKLRWPSISAGIHIFHETVMDGFISGLK